MHSNPNPVPPSNSPSKGNLIAGVLVIFVGFLFLIRQADIFYFIPNWITSWPMVLIIIGLCIGGTSNFKNPATWILIGIGSFFLLNKVVHINLWNIIWPAMVIGLGVWLIMDKRRPNRRYSNIPPVDAAYKPWEPKPFGASSSDNDTKADFTSNSDSFGPEQNFGKFNETWGDEYLQSTVVFSDVKKIILSKRFRGGEMVNVFGGTDINLLQADIQGPVVIEVFQLFAGSKIIIPTHWKVQSELTSIFGEVDDRRYIQGQIIDDSKLLILRGTSVFGGITIKNG